MIVCSQKKAAVIMVLVFLGILVIALIAAFARPGGISHLLSQLLEQFVLQG